MGKRRDKKQQKPGSREAGKQGRPELLAGIGDGKFAAILTAAFVVVLGVVVFNHEMWRDELQAWMIVRDSPTLAAMFANLSVEGHPSLWYLLLFPITRLTKDPLSMQMLNLVLAAAAVFVFVRFSPFTRLQKLLFAFSYYPLYEYGAISRNYAVGLLLAFAFCAMYPKRDRILIPIAAVLFLLADSSAYGFIIAACLAFFLAFSLISDKKPVSRGTLAAAAAIVLLGVGLSAYQMMPKGGETGLRVMLPLNFDTARSTVATFAASFALFPDISHQWFYIQKPQIVNVWQSILAIPLFLYIASVLSPKKRVMLLFIGAILAMLAFRTFGYFTFALRHHGHMFVMFIVCMWLANYQEGKPAGSSFIQKLSGSGAKFLTAVLVIQLIGGIAAAQRDIRQVYSPAKTAAQVIKANGLEDVPIVGGPEFSVSAVSGYLNKEIYYIGSNRTGTFVVWSKGLTPVIDEEDVTATLDRLESEKKQRMLLVLGFDMGREPMEFPAYTITLLGRSPTGMVKDETYWAYLVEPR